MRQAIQPDFRSRPVVWPLEMVVRGFNNDFNASQMGWKCFNRFLTDFSRFMAIYSNFSPTFIVYLIVELLCMLIRLTCLLLEVCLCVNNEYQSRNEPASI